MVIFNVRSYTLCIYGCLPIMTDMTDMYTSYTYNVALIWINHPYTHINSMNQHLLIKFAALIVCICLHRSIESQIPSGDLTQPWYRWPIYRWLTY